MGITYLFAYGTLQLEKVQLAVLNRRLKGNSDVLKGFQLGKIQLEAGDPVELAPQGYYPVAIPTAEAELSIEGWVYEINDDELRLLDQYEGKEYKRVSCNTESGKQAWVYIKS